MSRSHPQQTDPNPATRWYEWHGEKGVIRYYDKELKENILTPLPFTFLLLDELATVRGWHDASVSGIYSNEVRDTRTDVLLVKAFKGGTLAEGLYKDIKDRVNTVGGQFVTNLYIAIKQNGGLTMALLRFKGAALGAWMAFRKDHRHKLFDQAVVVTGYTEGKKGRITYRMPTFDLKPVAPDTNHQAITLDAELQAYLDGYFNRRTTDKPAPDEDAQLDAEVAAAQPTESVVDDIPF